MPHRIKPTSRSPQEESICKGNKSRNQSESNPTTATPAEWPIPQRRPGDQERRVVRTASGAIAAR